MFRPGLLLNEEYYFEIIAPILNKYNRKLKYSASLLGYGSDVLGYDDEISTDHNWGPRLQIFVDKENDIRNEIVEVLQNNLPATYKQYHTNFSEPSEDFTQRMIPTDGNKINHLIEVHNIELFFSNQIGVDICKLSLKDWLLIPEQVLIELTSGKVFSDGLEKLNRYRELLRYFPLDIQKLRLAAFWNCIANEEPFVGRAIRTNDLYSVKLITNRIINYLMKICFIYAKEYIVYSKWFGRKFNELPIPDNIKKLVMKTLYENNANDIEKNLCELYCQIEDLHNTKDYFPEIKNKITDFYGRPFSVIMASTIVDKILESIEDEELKKKPLQAVALDIKIDSEDFTDIKLYNILKM